MRKVIAAINMTLDGVFDHTAVDPDEEIHHHYADLLSHAGVLLYGRITYGLMEFWKPLAEKPSGVDSMDHFASVIDQVPKIVFSHTLKELAWKSAELAKDDLETEVAKLRQQAGKPVCVGSRSLIMQLMQLNLIDELQVCIHPVIDGSGLPLFETMHDRINLKLIQTKTFASGAVILYYQPSLAKS